MKHKWLHHVDYSIDLCLPTFPIASLKSLHFNQMFRQVTFLTCTDCSIHNNVVHFDVTDLARIPSLGKVQHLYEIDLYFGPDASHHQDDMKDL